MSRRVCTFAVAHTDTVSQPFNNAGRTVRVFAPNNLTGNAVFIKFSNYYSPKPVWVGNAAIALADSTGRIMPGTSRPLTVGGDISFAVVPNRDIVSDRIAMEVKPGQTIAVSLFYPSSDKVLSGNYVSKFAQRSPKGDFCNEPAFPKAKMLASAVSNRFLPWDITSATTTLSEVIVEQEDDAPRPRVIAAFGDSIMQQGAWVSPFTKRLYEAYPGAVSVCNLGIGGNRLLHGSPLLMRGFFGHEGMARYVSDLLPIEGLTHTIFALGTNDIGLPGKDSVPESDLITLKDYITGVTTVVDALHKQNVKVIGGTLLPRALNNGYTAAREELRLAMNRWIITSGVFDAVLDLGTAVADESGVGMKKTCDLPDGLHPNVLGGQLIADSIDLTVFE